MSLIPLSYIPMQARPELWGELIRTSDCSGQPHSRRRPHPTPRPATKRFCRVTLTPRTAHLQPVPATLPWHATSGCQ
eukprot:3580900-Rhodomonas_salina.2